MTTTHWLGLMLNYDNADVLCETRPHDERFEQALEAAFLVLVDEVAFDPSLGPYARLWRAARECPDAVIETQAQERLLDAVRAHLRAQGEADDAAR